MIMFLCPCYISVRSAKLRDAEPLVDELQQKSPETQLSLPFIDPERLLYSVHGNEHLRRINLVRANSRYFVLQP